MYPETYMNISRKKTRNVSPVVQVVHTTAHQMISLFFIYRTKTAAKCAKIEHAHAKRAELFFFR